MTPMRDVHFTGGLRRRPALHVAVDNGGPSPFAVRSHIERILSSSLFARSERMSRFLRFAVETSLGGRAGELKEYLIGVEVFDRGPTYDPRVDPIVRVEARRLRAKLKHYYETEGLIEPLRIELPTGGYMPRIHAMAPTKPIIRGNTIAVLPFSSVGGGKECRLFVEDLAEEIIHRLTEAGLRVAASSLEGRLGTNPRDVPDAGDCFDSAVLLRGAVRCKGRRLRITMQLLEAATGVYLWSEIYQGVMDNGFTFQEELARRAAGALRAMLGERFESGGSETGEGPSQVRNTRRRLAAF
jgi:serine/threonine-protein kinase